MLINKIVHKRKKPVAAILLFFLIIETFAPSMSYALTSGPSQPEMRGFEPVGVSNMVDPFTGDFSYNIPLLDVDGYPINLNYHAGSTPDDEASWVGYGWSLSPGAFNRQLRGLPDDFDGSDQVTKETNFKDHITKGLTTTVKLDVMGIPLKAGSISPSISLGVEYDNYRGIGTKLGFNAGITLGDMSASSLNANNEEKDVYLADIPSGKAAFSVGLSSSSLNGSSASVNFPVIQKQIEQGNSNLSSSIGFPYNSRAGLEGMSLSSSYNTSKIFGEQSGNHSIELNNSFISFASPTYIPTIDVPTKSTAFSASISAGVQVVPAFIGGGISGYYSKQIINEEDKVRKLNAYGMLYAEKGTNDKQALMDFNREKDIPYSKEVAYLPVPIPTNDLFMATSQGESGQYKISRNGHGVFFDPYTNSKGNDASVGVEVGFGLNWDIGADLFFQNSSSTTNKWLRNNDFLNFGDFKNDGNYNTIKEKAYFKKIGEPVVIDNDYNNSLSKDSLIAVSLKNTSGSDIGTATALRTKYGQTAIGSLIARNEREVRNQPVSYLTAAEAAMHGLEKTIRNYPENMLVSGNCNEAEITQLSRVTGYRKKHHISEITVTSTDGKRTIYGIPVYNTYQEDVSYSITGDTSNRATGLISSSIDPKSTAANSNSREKYYSKQLLPAYTTSYLLTAILSSDYVDVKSDGITDDDLGTAVKFNYHKLATDYQWRTPYGQFANYNEGFISDKLDDKASYSYGKKELWYLQSVESKTMVALFITENRNDGFGVLSNTGDPDTANHLKRLKEIRLYSKSDIKTNNGDLSKLTPVKVIHFEYSYSLLKGMPNSIDGEGKLTLKKIYFTYGKSDIGSLSPYTFEYNTDSVAIGTFNHRQYDRWGNFKDPSANPGGLNNAEFPYTLQNHATTDDFVSRWQLKKINLPTGGNITVDYEADDYAYVQNKRAMQMVRVSGVGSGGNATSGTGLINASEVFVDIPVAVENEREFMYRYLDGEQYLFFKFFTNLDDQGHYEFVPGYAKIHSVRMVSNTRAAISLEKEDVEGVGPTNPMAHTSWQFIRSNLPKYAYPGYENLENDGSDLKKAIQSLGTAVSNLQELIPNSFGKIAKRRNYGNSIDLAKSFVRLQSPSFSKIGGGLRVKRIKISDAWQELTGQEQVKTATYTQEFGYTKTIKDYKGNDITVSSGVASYEPLIGGEENPFHQPVFYKQNVILQLDNYYYIEQPFCEGLYPAANVGYSQVSIKSIGSGELESRTGEVINEFYTAKDYPTQVDVLSLEKSKYGSSRILSIITAKLTESIGLSQGYRIENNDMHGKPKAVSVYNLSGIKIAATSYYYKTLNQNEEIGKLDNRVKLLMPDATVVDGIIGKDIEAYTDMRESVSLNEGTKLQGSFGSAGFFIFSIPFGFPGFGSNYHNRTYHSASTVKIINDFAVLDKVIKMENGSSVTTENVLWDGISGDVLMTKTQNEFDDPVYQLSIPANWAYDGMGQSYQNQGVYLSDIVTNGYGQVINSNITQFLKSGDELADLNSGNHYWVINTLNQFALIDKDGYPISNATIISAKILRSGYRNILSAPLCSYVSLRNPVAGNRLDISTASKILASEATEFAENWVVPKAVCSGSCPEGYTLSADGTSCYLDTAVTTSGVDIPCTTVCAGDYNNSYASGGTRIYNTGFDGNGDGTFSTISYSNSFWIQGGTCGTCLEQTQNSIKGIQLGKVTAESGVQTNPTFNKGIIINAGRQKISSSAADKTKTLFEPSTNTIQPKYHINSSVPDQDSMNAYMAGQISVSTNAVKPAKNKTTTKKSNSFTAKTNSSSGPGSQCNITPAMRDTTHCSPLERTGIWSCQGNSFSNRLPLGQWIGFSKTISVASSKTFYIGMAADNYFRFKVDGATVLQKLTLTQDNFNYWSIYPVYLSAGTHVIQMEAKNENGPATMGAEIYDNTSAEIAAAVNYCELNIIFSTKDMIGQDLNSGNESCPEGYNLVATAGGNVCRKTIPSAVYNPYVSGHLGNWRPEISYSFQTKRETLKGDPSLNGSTNTRYAGSYLSFVPFWQYTNNGGLNKWTPTGKTDNRWVGKNQATAFNNKGFSIEEKDPLNRYSSVLLGYLDSKPVAAASNARYTELVFDGFEDYSFLLDCSTSSCTYNHFNFKQAFNSNIGIDNSTAHSGVSSLKVAATLNITQSTNQLAPISNQYTINNTSGLYMLNQNTAWSNGFTPVAGKKYLISFWIKDGSPRSPNVNTAVKINGTDIINTSQKWTVVEGWKRVEIPFVVPASNQLTFSIVPSGTIWLDDIRIAPFDSQVKSYAYDPISQRLMAEMDENNFATFYEYDSEGTLIRVKKETEKGIVTIKETRSSYKRQ